MMCLFLAPGLETAEGDPGLPNFFVPRHDADGLCSSNDLVMVFRRATSDIDFFGCRKEEEFWIPACCEARQ